MTTLNLTTFTAATEFIYASTGDSLKKGFLVDALTDAGVEAKVANKVWTIMRKSGRVDSKGQVIDLTGAFNFDATSVVKDVLLALQSADSGLTQPLVTALYKVTGLSFNRIQGALNALENEGFLEQRRAVAPWQYVPRNWAN